MDFASFSLDGPKGRNQDRLLEPFQTHDAWITAIADGVGGNFGGEIAAEAAISIVRTNSAELEHSAKDVFKAACRQIRSITQTDERLSKMATTLSVLRLQGLSAQVAHAGDARIYHVRGDGIQTRTIDHTEVAQLLRDKVLSRRQAQSYPRRNVITSYLSADESFSLFEAQFAVQPGDYILLLTDGAYSPLAKRELVEFKKAASSLKDFTARTKEALLSRSVRDDSSLIAIEV